MLIVKGQFYDEHFEDFSVESDTSDNRLGLLGGEVLDVSTPAIAQELDTTRAIEERIAVSHATPKNSEEEVELHSQIKMNYPTHVAVVDICSAQVDEPLEESTQMLLNLYDLQSIYLEDGREVERIKEPDAENQLKQKVNEKDEKGVEVVEESRQVHQEDNTETAVVERVEAEKEEDAKKDDKYKDLSLKLLMKNQECDRLGAQLFEINQQMKISMDRIHQLENSNQYRSEVVKLEKALHIKEDYIKTLQEEIKGSTKDKEELVLKLGKACEEKEIEGKKYLECKGKNEEDASVIASLELILEENKNTMKTL